MNDFNDLLFGATDDLAATKPSAVEGAEFKDSDFTAVVPDDLTDLRASATVDTPESLLDLDGAQPGAEKTFSISDLASDLLKGAEQSEEGLATPRRPATPANPFSGAVGCAILEIVGGIAGAGVASRNGAESFAFRNVDELRERHPDTLWITSAAPNTFSMQQGLRSQWLRDSRFFQTPLFSIIQEMGIAEGQTSIAVQIASEVMARSIRLASGFFSGMDFPGEPGTSFADILHPFVASEPRREAASRDVIDAIQSTFACPLPVDAQARPHDLVLRLPLQRARHMEAVLAGAVPEGQWREVNLRQVGDSLAWALEPGRAVLALVSVRNMGDAAGLLFKRGSSPRSKKAWLAKPELDALSPLMDLRIERMFAADEQVPAVSALRCPPPLMEPVDHAAMSSGLFCEAFLAAACSPAPARRSMARNGEDSVSLAHSSRAAWLTSAARAVAFEEAAALAAQRFNVIGYGLSHVMLSLPKADLRRLRSYLLGSERLMHLASVQ